MRNTYSCYFAAENNLLRSQVSTLQSEKAQMIKEKDQVASSHQAQLTVQKQEHAAEVEQLKEQIHGLEQSLATHNKATDQEVVMHLEAARDLWGKEFSRRFPSCDLSFMKLIDVVNYVEEQTENAAEQDVNQ
jgi:ABC-type sulfate transport system substrate-binding protein